MNFKELFTSDEEYYENDAAAKAVPGNIALFEPKSFEDSTEIALALKADKSVVINLSKLQREYAQRTIDFLTGVCYSLDAKIEKIGHNLIVCVPKNVGLEGTISLGE